MFKTLEIDIETCPCEAWVWDGGKQYVTAEQILEPSRIICIAYKWAHQDKVSCLSWDNKQDDKKMLKEFTKVAEQADAVVGHNGKRFDLRVINARIAYHQLDPLPLTFVEDTLTQTRSKFKLPSYKLSYLVEYFKVGHKLSTTGGLALWMRVWKDNDQDALEEMMNYCKNDVKVLAALRVRIQPYVKPTINKTQWLKDPEACSHCGSTNSVGYGSRMTSVNRVAYRRKCKDCLVVFTSYSEDVETGWEDGE